MEPARSDTLGPAFQAAIDMAVEARVRDLTERVADLEVRLSMVVAPPVLTIKEACEVLRISLSQFHKLKADADSGLHEALIGSGRSVRVDRAALLRWVQERQGPRRRRKGRA